MASAAMAAGTSNTHCASDEQTIFSCPIAHTQKVLSVCGSKRLGSNEGFLQYRYGSVGKIELTYPQSRTGTQEKFRWVTNEHLDVTDSWLTFRNASVSYSVFSMVDHPNGMGPVTRRNGLILEGNNGISQTLKCAAPVIDHLEMLRDILEKGDVGNS